jgi:hypothetical protein
MASVFLSDSRNPILFQSSANFTDLFYNPELAFRTGTSIATYFFGARPMRIGVEKDFSSHFLFNIFMGSAKHILRTGIEVTLEPYGLKIKIVGEQAPYGVVDYLVTKGTLPVDGELQIQPITDVNGERLVVVALATR